MKFRWSFGERPFSGCSHRTYFRCELNSGRFDFALELRNVWCLETGKFGVIRYLGIGPLAFWVRVL